jgi:hypothetical protein
MHHVEQQILELYVLNTAAVESRRPEIESHLAECAGCCALVEQMRESYKAVEEKFEQLEARSEVSEQSLAARVATPERQRYRDAKPAVSYRPVTAMQRFQYFVRRHPVVTGGGTFVAFAGLALLTNVVLKSPVVKDENPANVHYNPTTNSVEVLNKNNDALWQIPSREISGVLESEHRTGTSRIVVDDIDGDGRNEVLSTLWNPGDGAATYQPVFRVYDYKKNLLFSKRFEEQVHYLNRSYSDSWSTDIVVTVEGETKGRKDIYVAWGNGRSPFVIARYDASGNELGQYWHFGNLLGMFAIDANGDGTKELILTGTNDTLDSLHQEFPSIAVLDPRRIVGKKKSVCSPGFALQESDAEFYYLRLPVSPLSVALVKHETVTRLTQDRDGTLAFMTTNTSASADPNAAAYEYRFSSDFKILEVKSTSGTDQLFARKVKEGVVKGTIDVAYLTALKAGVRYWDGKEWRKEAFRIKHKNQLSVVNGQQSIVSTARFACTAYYLPPRRRAFLGRQS